MWPVFRLEIHQSLGSTSEECRRRVGEAAGLAVMARRQEAGRGSFGRNWASPEGNLYISVLLKPAGKVGEGGLWSLLAAVAVADAVAAVVPDGTLVRLKWPNDVLLDGGKVAGILLDSAADAGGRFASLVIGVGLNIVDKPTLAERRTARLADVMAPPTADAMAARLLDSLARWIDVQAGDGFAPIRAAWQARGPAPGTALRLVQGTVDTDGTFAGLAEDGSIVLDIAGHRRAFAAGEVRLLPGA